MANLDWAKHDEAITNFVRRVTNYYLRTSATTGQLLREDQGILLRNNYATPERIGKLLTYLGVVSHMVQHKIDVMGNPPETIQNIQADLSDWEARLAEYKLQTQAAKARDPDASGDTDQIFWDRVTRPLLLGLYPGEEYQRVLDAVTPITLAWQIEVAKDAYDFAEKSFWSDLKQSAIDLPGDLSNFGSGLLVLGLTVLAFGYGFGKGTRR